MTPNHVKQTLRAGRPAVGSWLNLGCPISAEAVAALGYASLCIDMVGLVNDRRVMTAGAKASRDAILA